MYSHNSNWFLPAITIFPQNPVIGYGNGWKVGYSCPGSGKRYIQCVEENTYSEDDIFVYDTLRASTLYGGWKEGLIQSLDLDIGNITNNFDTTMEVALNSI